MAQGRILAIDQGTTNTKVVLVDDAGAVVSRASRPVAIAFPQPGWVEQDGMALWRTVEEAIDDCLAQAPAARSRRRRHQSTRVGAALGSRHRPPGRPVHRLAVPSHGGLLRDVARPWPPAAARSEDRPDDRPTLLGQQDSLAARRDSGRPPRGQPRASLSRGPSTVGCSGT